jgi:hypothetical protein
MSLFIPMNTALREWSDAVFGIAWDNYRIVPVEHESGMLLIASRVICVWTGM